MFVRADIFNCKYGPAGIKIFQNPHVSLFFNENFGIGLNLHIQGTDMHKIIMTLFRPDNYFYKIFADKIKINKLHDYNDYSTRNAKIRIFFV